MLYKSIGQDLAQNNTENVTYAKAFDLAYEGDHKSAQEVLIGLVHKKPNDVQARSLLASTLSWNRKYDKARLEFNKITSKDRHNREVWISAIKNELYAKKGATALGLANKALNYLKKDTEIERLKQLAIEQIENKKYTTKGWFNQESGLTTSTDFSKKVKSKDLSKKKEKKEKVDSKTAQNKESNKTEKKQELKNRFSVRNSFTAFDERYDPVVFSSLSFRHKSKYGSIIPSINYSSRSGKQGLQYDVSLYPKLAKRMYAFLNYGYSNASIYPNHKVAGDVYIGLPGAIEFSAGGRYISTDTRNVTSITNSLGHYRGNYYFSLRSYVTPRPDRLTRVSGSILVRRYFRDAENYFGVNFGMGFSPELRQLIVGNELLAETLLYVESQRLSLAYQFSSKKGPNVYLTSLGVRRQELAFDSGSFVWAISAGLTYRVKF